MEEKYRKIMENVGRKLDKLLGNVPTKNDINMLKVPVRIGKTVETP